MVTWSIKGLNFQVWPPEDGPRGPQRDPPFGQVSFSRQQGFAIGWNTDASQTSLNLDKNLGIWRRLILDSTFMKIIFKSLADIDLCNGLGQRRLFHKFKWSFTCLKGSFECRSVLGILRGILYTNFRSLYTHSLIKNPKLSIKNKYFKTLKSYSLPKTIPNSIEHNTQGWPRVEGFGRFHHQIIQGATFKWFKKGLWFSLCFIEF